MFSEPPECRSGRLKNQIVAEVSGQGFLEPSKTAYSGKFMRWRRGERQRGGRPGLMVQVSHSAAKKLLHNPQVFLSAGRASS